MKTYLATLLVLSMSWSASARAGNPDREDEKGNGAAQAWYLDGDVNSLLDKDSSRFMPYGTSYAIWQETEDDEQALEAHYSFLFSIYDCRRSKKIRGGDNSSAAELKPRCESWDFWQPAVFVSYTGEFDFYMGTRDSGPVVNRLNNPALHLYTRIGGDGPSTPKTDRLTGIRYLDISVEHRSNGQVTEIDELNADGLLRTQVAYNNDDHEFFDTLSRGSNYVGVRMGTHNRKMINWQVGYKAYFTRNAEVNWGPLAGTGVNIDDFDLVQIGFGKSFFDRSGKSSVLNFSLNYTVGKKGFETDSADLSVAVPLTAFSGTTQFPLLLRVHHGPMDTLSNYTKSVTSVGLGFSFWNGSH